MLSERVDFIDALRRALRLLRSGSLNDWLRLKPAVVEVDVPILLVVAAVYELKLELEPDKRLCAKFEWRGE